MSTIHRIPDRWRENRYRRSFLVDRRPGGHLFKVGQLGFDYVNSTSRNGRLARFRRLEVPDHRKRLRFIRIGRTLRRQEHHQGYSQCDHHSTSNRHSAFSRSQQFHLRHPLLAAFMNRKSTRNSSSARTLNHGAYTSVFTCTKCFLRSIDPTLSRRLMRFGCRHISPSVRSTLHVPNGLLP